MLMDQQIVHIPSYNLTISLLFLGSPRDESDSNELESSGMNAMCSIGQL